MLQQVIDQRRHSLGLLEVGRVLPHRSRRMVGPFVFFDHMGPVQWAAGLPREADIVFDARFLANPHYVAALKPLSGRDRAVQEYVEADPDYSAFASGIKALLGPLLPRYEKEGKSYLTVAVGCTGGRHRSVFLAETIAAWLKTLGRNVTLAHRDLPAEPGPRDDGAKSDVGSKDVGSQGVIG